MKAALLYAQNGWAVLPDEPNGKRPILANWPEAATSDLEVVQQWVEKYPTANIGIATGAKSGFFVLDVDGERGRASVSDLVTQHGPFPKTATQRTGSGGAHYLFKIPDFAVANSASKIAPGIDIRGENGQIVVAPSVTPSGKYSWIVPPWECEPAEAPEWLLALLRPKSPERENSQARGSFPPASPAVLADAREALAEHGPAIEGEGGDEHTFIAAATLVNDFALTDEEAWPLFLEWNETCQPPWAEDDLSTKLRMGRRERERAPAYGCKRRRDFVAEIKFLCSEWRVAGGRDEDIPALRQAISDIIRDSGDKGVRAIAERALSEETGLRPIALALPRVRGGAPIPREAIEVTPDVHEVANAAVKTLAAVAFQRAGILCEVIEHEQAFIQDLETPRIQDLLSKQGKYFRNDERGQTAQAPPMPIAAILHARRSHIPEIRTLDAVTTSPVVLEDGTILSEAGYNQVARLWLKPNVKVAVPASPKREDAQRSIEKFRELLSDFTFQTPADFSTWLAGLLTPLCKTALKNAPAPLFCVSASSAGAGKSLLTNLIARIITGKDAENSPYNPKDPAEWGKRLTAFVRMGSPIRVLDNCNGAFGDEGLDRLITSPTWSDRILGVTEAPPLPNVTTWFATGNNIEPVGDTVRRVAVCRLRVDVERPQERSEFKIKEIGEYTTAHRAELLGAALTILRAYFVADKPPQKIPTWGSFEVWSKLVRSTLVWAGLEDPYLTQERAMRELGEPENVAHDFWLSIISASPGEASEIAAKANLAGAGDVLGLRGEVTSFGLKSLVQRFIDKPRRGRRIVREIDHGTQQARFRVISV